jgi:copper chaperone CopZ
MTSLATDFTSFVRHKDGLAAIDLAVDGIQCAGCMTTIEKGLKTEPGLVSARVNLASKRVTVSWQDGRENPQGVIRRLDEMGFRAYPFATDKVESAEAREERRLRAQHVRDGAPRGRRSQPRRQVRVQPTQRDRLQSFGFAPQFLCVRLRVKFAWLLQRWACSRGHPL